MSIPQIVGTAYGQGPSDGSAPIVVSLPPGAQSYIALAWPGEHHVLTVPTGWSRKTYWTDGLAAAPMNMYYAEAVDSPGTSWQWGNYTDPEDPERWTWHPTITLLIIGLDRTLSNNWPAPGEWTASFQNTMTSTSWDGTDDALGLSILGVFAVGAGDALLASPASTWSGVTVLEAGPNDSTPAGGTSNTNWDLGVAEADGPGGDVPSLVWTWASGSVSLGTDAGSAAITLMLHGTDSAPLDVTPAAIAAAPSVSTVPIALDPGPASELDVTPAAITAAPSVATVAVAMQPAPTTPPFCTSVAPSGRYFLDQYGQPFWWRMECNWFIAARNPSVWANYLTTRQAQGFTVIEIALATSNTYDDTDNGIPMQDAADGLILNLNQEWLDQLRSFIDTAATYGMTVLFNPAYGWEVQPGWTSAADFANLLHSNFGTAPNVLWGFGVDYPSADWSTHNPTILATISALRSAGSTQPVMVQNMPTGKAADPATSGLTTDNSDFIGVTDFEFAYAYAAPYDLIRRGYAAGHGPVVLGESNFEAENNEGGPSTTNETLRRQALWTMTCGGVGWDYGHRDIWRGNVGWELALSTPVQSQLTSIADAFKAIDWWRLVPDIGNTFLTSGQGVKPSSGTQDYGLVDPLESTYATAAVSADGSVGVVYVPTGRSFGVNLAKLGTSRAAYRVDPTSGATTTLTVSSSYSNPGTNAAGGSDWLYVFEAEPFAASGGPAVVVGGVETAATWTVIIGGVEVPVVSWSIVQGGVEAPLT